MYTVQKTTIINERLYAKINDEWYVIGTGVKHVECYADEMRVFTEFSTIPADISYKISFEEDKGIRIITSFIGMVLGEAPLKLDTIIETSGTVIKDTPDVAEDIKTCYARDKEKKEKTLNEIRKEHGFVDVVARELERDAERYAWNKYIDNFEARWNHDTLKAHLNEKLVNDNVDSPNHYKLRGLEIEAIDVIRGALTEEEFRGFCKGNVLKYTIREGHKNGDEDLKKAKKYLEFLGDEEDE